MTQMLSLLAVPEVKELRGYLERCVEGLESGSPPMAARKSRPKATAKAKSSARPSPKARRISTRSRAPHP
jgi:hypothetical protein